MEKEHRLDARVDAPAVSAALPALGGTDPRGNRIAFTTAFMTWNGRPWIAAAGEFHYARFPAPLWRDELLKMRAGGIDVVSTYVFWIHHEEDEGDFEWTGDRDLRRFITTCAMTGLFAIVRIGPFCHGEVRNGGLPDWLYGRPFPLRANDERYLAYVRRLYGEIGRQLAGLFFKDGGPIVGIQLENELGHAGAPWETVPCLAQESVTAGAGGAEHLRTLKRTARESGIDAPLFTSTAWGGAPVLVDEILPLYGGYAFCPWNVTEAAPVHTPTREYVFRSFRRPGRRDDLFDPPYDPSTVPFACCEIGGGMQSWYRCRLRVPPESIEAMAVMKLAGGCSVLGYYMYHGGSNPVGRHGWLNEHVVPRVSYDFQAPLGEYGQTRESYRRLRRLHLLCRHFGEQLAPAEPVLPAGAEDLDPRDTGPLRYAARARDGRGFLFLNGYQDHVETQDHEDVRIRIDLPGGPVRLPREGGFTLKKDTSAILPFNLDLSGVRVVSSTAQPLARLDVDGVEHAFFFAHDGMAAEYCLESAGSLAVERPRPGLHSRIELRGAAEKPVVLRTLTAAQSLQLSVLELWGRPRALITAADLFADGEELHLRTDSGNPVELFALPGPPGPLVMQGAHMEASPDGDFTRLRFTLPASPVPVDVRRHGDGDAEIRLPGFAFEGTVEILLRIEYDGDVGNAFIDGRLVADDFANAAPWEIGLRRFLPDLVRKGMYIHVTPRREGSMVIRESGMALQQELQGKEIARIRSIEATAVREVVLMRG